jgi:glutamate---cysteine ligase / carboxylate-amine ligase
LGTSQIDQPRTASADAPLPLDALSEWSEWAPSASYTVGIEEEVLVLDPGDWSLAQRTDEILATLSPCVSPHAAAETHEAAIELATLPSATAEGAAREAAGLRAALAADLARSGLRAASAGTHPFALWSETRVSSGARYQLIYESMRELARREPTFALHVHVGMPDPESAVELLNRLRPHIPLLLALSANSPYWQGRDSGFCSARTPIFQAFPRVGIPRAFGSYGDYVDAINQLLRCDAFPEPTFLWWDVRLQPSLGTVELRIMDTQPTPVHTAALAAAVQTIAHLELEEGYHPAELIDAPELLQENRFLAARDGVEARLLDPIAGGRVAVSKQLEELYAAGLPHAQELGCVGAFELIRDLVRSNGAKWQRSIARRSDLRGLLAALSLAFASTI